MGHALKGCDAIEADKDNPNLQYGTWLRAFPLKPHRRNAESELLEGKKKSSFPLFTSRVPNQNLLKVLFNNPTYQKMGSQNETPNATESSSMLIDVDATVMAGNGAFKRKQKDASLQKKGDYKVRVVDMTPETSSSSSVSAEVTEQPRLAAWMYFALTIEV